MLLLRYSHLMTYNTVHNFISVLRENRHVRSNEAKRAERKNAEENKTFHARAASATALT